MATVVLQRNEEARKFDAARDGELMARIAAAVGKAGLFGTDA